MLFQDSPQLFLLTTVDKRSQMLYNMGVIKGPPMQDEYLTRCVVDPMNRKFFIYSNEGDERVVDCETIDQFMSVLDLVRSQCADDVIAYVNPLDCAKIDS